MSKKDIIIVIAGLAILAAIIVASYLLPGEEDVRVLTDKEEYALGEDLKVKIDNDSGDKLCFSTCYPYYLERKDGDWTSYKYIDCPEEDKVDSCVDPDQVRAFELKIPPVDKGIHRLMIQACVGCETNEVFKKEKELISNQFIIK